MIVGCGSADADHLFSNGDSPRVQSGASGQMAALGGDAEQGGRSPISSSGGTPGVIDSAPGDHASGAPAAAAQGGASTNPSTDPGPQSGAPPVVQAGAPPVVQAGATGVDVKNCAGTLLGGVCWYLAALGDSCTATCRQHGAYDPLATLHVGTTMQGGSLEKCSALFTALGMVAEVSEGTRDKAQGLGCHLFGTPPVPWWLSDPPFDPDASRSKAREICGCTE